MGRKNRRVRDELRALPNDGGVYFGTRTVPGPRWAAGEPFEMRHMGASAAQKYYICPGCNQNIPPGTAHIVAWPKEIGRGTEDRRHWHRGCWDRR
ncbi:hypothetical protein [Corynebacterium gerontici]|uniref:hypothetical protein n=1 Tax=Corynebacterium gerontici TaxID=2079234 RepID=UPI000F5075B2|nr:hypothetical protein [Corynebacterium gerontici]